MIANYSGEILAFTSAIVWAFAVILFKKSGEHVHPIALTLFKCMLSFLLLIPTIYIFGGNLLIDVPLKTYGVFILSGILGIGIADTLFFVGLNNLGASLSAIVGCTYSPLIIFLSFLFLGEKLTSIQIIGVVAILSAILTANIDRGDIHPSNWRRGIIAAILGNINIAFGVIIMKPYLADVPLLWATGVRIFGGVIALIFILSFSRNRTRIISSLKASGSFKFTLSGTILGSYLAMILWLGGMKFTQASTAAVLNQTSNVFVFIFAAVFLREKMSPMRVLGIILAVGGAIIVSIGK